MDTTDKNTERDNACKRFEQQHRRGKIAGGLLIVAAGTLFLARELGAEIPYWLFTWKVLLIAIGLVLGVKHKFMHAGWLVLVVIGGAFLVTDMYPAIAIKPLLWPVLLIAFGLFIIFKPKRKRKEQYWKKWEKHYEKRYSKYNRECFMNEEASTTSEDLLDSVTFMGGIKKNVITKNFKGGDVTAVFGGVEINLLQADFNESATLELTCVFAGIKLIIPSNWEINSDFVSAFGSVEDKRQVQPKNPEEITKILVLKGNVFFGGIEIRNY